MPLEVFNRLSAAERELHDALPLLDQMEECGRDCQAFREMVQTALDRTTAAKRNFKPANVPGI